jgi:hypothetical protein
VLLSSFCRALFDYCIDWADDISQYWMMVFKV